jgi:type II secretory pathway pseudopilin PulG
LRRHGKILAAAALSLALTCPMPAREAGCAPTQQQSQSSAQLDQERVPGGPADTLANAFSAACRHDVSAFTDFLTSSSGAAYRGLPPNQQIGLLKRFVQLEDPGQPLRSTDANGGIILRCDTPSITAEIRLGTPRIDENLAFVPVALTKDRKVDFGMVRASSGWKVFAIGLVVLDIPQLTAEWSRQAMEDREEEAMAALRTIAQALDSYRRAFEKLPESLLQLGPAPKNGISPDTAGLLDSQLAQGQAGGYSIRYRILPSDDEETHPSGYELAATPKEYGKSGVRSFFIDSTGKMRGGDKQGGPATSGDPPVNTSAQ